MVRDVRIKSYMFPESSGNATTISSYSEHNVNGEILRIDAFANFTGSVILKESGTGYTFCNYGVASGTNLWGNQPFSNTTGSFVTSSTLMLTIGSLVSGTAVKFGPILVLYR